MCLDHKMIDPFIDHQVSEGKISYGLSSMGYDVRISDEFRIFVDEDKNIYKIEYWYLDWGDGASIIVKNKITNIN